MKSLVVAMMFLFLDLVGAQQLQYRLSVPDGWDHWVLLDDPGAAWGCYAHAADSETKSYIDDSERSEHLATYKSGAIAVVIGDPFTGDSDPGGIFAYEIRIVSGEQRGKEGWVSAKLVELTKESKALQAKRNAAEAQRRKKKQEEREAEQSARIAENEAERTRLRNKCAQIYDKTADKKISDLTVRESQQVQACQAAGLYPPT